MTDLITTITEEDNIRIVEESSDTDEDEEKVVTKSERKNKKIRGHEDFNKNFKVFAGLDSDLCSVETITLDSVLKSVLKPNQSRSTLDEKIAKVRKERLLNKSITNNKTITASKSSSVESNIPNQPITNLDTENVNLGLENEQDIEGDISSDSDDETNLITDKVSLKQKKKVKKNQKFIDEVKDFVQMKKTENADEKMLTDSEFYNNFASWDESMSFKDMNLSRPLTKGTSVMNYVTPTPVQQAAIPMALLGKDLCVCASTGTGKTAAFMLPILERLIHKPRTAPVVRVLCLVPTRELAVQVHVVTRQLSQFTSVQVCLAAGGLDLKSQEAALRQGPDVVIATPGRLIDHLHNTPSFQLSNVEILVLDEADRMLDEFFAEQMNEIIKLCAPQRQTMLFSATMTDKVNDLAAVSLRDPTKLFINSNTEVSPFLHQEFIRIRQNREGERESIVSALCSRTFVSNVLIFTQTKKQAHRMHIVLGLLGLKVGELHGNLNQSQRLDSLQRFKFGEIDILVCTDLAARGLDIENVKTVINFTMPNSVQHYVHRVGRTARAGKSGRSVSLVGETERKMLKLIVKQAKNPVKSRTVPPEVVAKYKLKLQELDEDVGQVLRMEAVEKHLAESEKQVKRAKKILEPENREATIKREWFQTKIEKELIRAENMLGKHSEAKNKNNKLAKSKKFSTPKTASDRANIELEKVMAYQKREAKRNKRVKRSRACAEDPIPKKVTKTSKKKKSSFEKELTDTSKFKSKRKKQFKGNQGMGKKKTNKK